MKQSVVVFTILLCVCAAFPAVAQQNAAQTQKTTLAPDSMVQIPAGEFWMGRSNAMPEDAEDRWPRGWLDDRPANLINVDAFSIDKYEVTNADYAKFLEAKGGKPPWHWPEGRIAEGQENQAVSNVNWFEATEFCKWAGKRLPTEAEWEKAARGGMDRKVFPWGDESNGPEGGPFPAVINQNKAQAVGTLKPNGYGLYDMIGNVMEWTNDWFDAQYYNFMPKNNPKGPETGLYKSVRGGGWAEGRGMKLANFYRNFTDPELRFDTVGIRCAK